MTVTPAAGAQERRVSACRTERPLHEEVGMPKDRGEKGTERPTATSGGKSEGDMTVREAGRLGGHKGGQRVKELIEEGKRAEGGVEDEKKR